MLSPPFYELDGQIAVDLPGARAVFTTSAWGDLRETWLEVAERLTVRIVEGAAGARLQGHHDRGGTRQPERRH